MDELLEEFLTTDTRLIGLADYLIRPSDSWGKEKSFKQLTMDINFIILSANENKE